jgi:hypothetical protein
MGACGLLGTGYVVIAGGAFVCTVWVVGVVVAGGSCKRCQASVETLGSVVACCTLGIAVLISDTLGSVGIAPLAPVVSINY